MYVVTRSASPMAGMGDLGSALTALGAARSPTMMYPPNQATVARALNESVGWYGMGNLAGCAGGNCLGQTEEGFFSKIPTWVWWGAGGVAIGGVVGYFLLKKKGR